MNRARHWSTVALIAALALGLAITPAEALVGTRGQHPVTGDRNAPSRYAELTFPNLPVVVAVQETVISPTAFIAPDGTPVTDPAAAGYSFSTTWRHEDGWVGDFYSDSTRAGADGSLIFSPAFNHVPGIHEAGIVIHNPSLGTSEYQLVRFEYVREGLGDVTNPQMDAIYYRGLTAKPGYSFSLRPEIWSRATGDELAGVPAGYTFRLGQPDAQRGWSVPDFVSVRADGTVVANPGASEPYATYLVPVVVTDGAGHETTTAVEVGVGEIILKGPFGNYPYGESSAASLFSGSSR